MLRGTNSGVILCVIVIAPLLILLGSGCAPTSPDKEEVINGTPEKDRLPLWTAKSFERGTYVSVILKTGVELRGKYQGFAGPNDQVAYPMDDSLRDKVRSLPTRGQKIQIIDTSGVMTSCEFRSYYFHQDAGQWVPMMLVVAGGENAPSARRIDARDTVVYAGGVRVAGAEIAAMFAAKNLPSSGAILLLPYESEIEVSFGDIEAIGQPHAPSSFASVYFALIIVAAALGWGMYYSFTHWPED